jgi:nucleotide-binding universal stress UspA family protein
LGPDANGAILLGIDGEPHTEAAIRWALMLARQQDRDLVAVHVRDPYLKQFEKELYAQGRQEYLRHVDDCLAAVASQATDRFGHGADAAGVRWRAKILDGDPIEQLAREAQRGDYALLVLGRRPRQGFAAWRSRDLPGKLLAAVSKPVVVLVPDFSRTLPVP